MPREPRPDDRARAAAGEPPEPLHSKAHTIGTVKYWHDSKGHGAISSESTAPWDIWCHFSALEMEGFKSLVPGERVAVDYYRANQESFRYVAERVRRLDSGVGTSESAEGAG